MLRKESLEKTSAWRCALPTPEIAEGPKAAVGTPATGLLNEGDVKMEPTELMPKCKNAQGAPSIVVPNPGEVKHEPTKQDEIMVPVGVAPAAAGVQILGDVKVEIEKPGMPAIAACPGKGVQAPDPTNNTAGGIPLGMTGREAKAATLRIFSTGVDHWQLDCDLPGIQFLEKPEKSEVQAEIERNPSLLICGARRHLQKRSQIDADERIVIVNAWAATGRKLTGVFPAHTGVCKKNCDAVWNRGWHVSDNMMCAAMVEARIHLLDGQGTLSLGFFDKGGRHAALLLAWATCQAFRRAQLPVSDMYHVDAKPVCKEFLFVTFCYHLQMTHCLNSLRNMFRGGGMLGNLTFGCWGMPLCLAGLGGGITAPRCPLHEGLGCVIVPPGLHTRTIHIRYTEIF